MLEFRPCYGEHLKYLDVQNEQKQDYHIMLMPEQIEAVTAGFSLSAWEGSRCVGAAGLLNIYPHRALAWALLSRHAGPHMMRIARKVRSVLEFDPTSRIEMTVNASFENGRRFALAIGMQQETGILRKHGIRGEDEIMYVRIK